MTRYVDKDHIVPRSQRPSDGLDSLVVTFSEINKWKGNRTAWQFVSEEQGKPVPGLPNLSILSLTRYRQFVEALDTGGHDDDQRRKKRRKELLLLPKYEEKEFTPRDLTQTSQLVRLGAQVLRKNFPHLTTGKVISLPGSVTGAVRKAWKVLGCLATANPQVLDENGDVKTKTDIRDITHLHHALDACVLGLASHFVPNNGRVWELIVKRRLDDPERRELAALGIFSFNAEKRFEMRDLDPKLKDQIRRRLAEKRVVQHIPARMDGLRVEQNTWRVRAVDQGEVTIEQRVRQPNGSRPRKPPQKEKATKLLGLQAGKLNCLKGALVVPENFGAAILDRAPEGKERFVIVPWHKVHVRIHKGLGGEKSLVDRNGGRPPRILRTGMLIRIAGLAGKQAAKNGIWRVFSVKQSKKLDLGSPDRVVMEDKGPGVWREVSLETLGTKRIVILPRNLTARTA